MFGQSNRLSKALISTHGLDDSEEKMLLVKRKCYRNHVINIESLIFLKNQHYMRYLVILEGFDSRNATISCCCWYFLHLQITKELFDTTCEEKLTGICGIKQAALSVPQTAEIRKLSLMSLTFD